MSRRIIAGTIALATLSLIALLPSAAYAADVQSCQILGWSPSYPNSVSPGQTIQVVSTINAACSQWRTYYSARVDLVDRSTNRLFSTSVFQIGWQPDVNATISNSATAPQTPGEWKLQLNLYIFEEASMVGSPFKNTFNINVADPNASTQQSATSVAAAIVQQQPASNATATTQAVSQSTAAAISSDTTTSETAYIAIGLAITALLGLVVLGMTSKQRTQGMTAEKQASNAG